VVHAVTAWGFAGFFVALDRLGLCSQYKISRDAPHLRPDAGKTELDRRAIKELVLGTFVVVPIFVFLTAPYLSSAGIEVRARASGRAWHESARFNFAPARVPAIMPGD
jgi:hypothetical protein